MAAGVERRPVEGWIAVQAVEAVARQNAAKRRRNRNATLGIETQHVMGHKPVHLAPRRVADRSATPTGLRPVHPRHPRRGPDRISGSPAFVGTNGLSWVNMGVNGPALAEIAAPRDTD